MAMPPLLSQFPAREIVDASWDQVIITTALRHESTWSTLRDWVSETQEWSLGESVCTGIGKVEDGLGVYLLNRRRQYIYAEFSEVSRSACLNTKFEDDHLIDPQSIADMVAVYFQSTPESQAEFDQLTFQCRHYDQELRTKLGDRYQEAALLETEEYLEFHRNWLVPKLNRLFIPAH